MKTGINKTSAKTKLNNQHDKIVVDNGKIAYPDLPGLCDESST